MTGSTHPAPGAAARIFRVVLLRLVVPGVMAAGVTWLILVLTGFGDGVQVPIRNLLLPPFVIFVLWNALVTIASAYVAREAKRSREVDHGV